MGQYHHLSLAEREGITMMRRERMGVRGIARAIGRDKSTVSGSAGSAHRSGVRNGEGHRLGSVVA